MGIFDDDDDENDEATEELAETDYFVFYGSPDRDTAKITSGPALPEDYTNWRDGAKIPVEIPQPLVYEIEEDDEGILRPYFDALGAPIMSLELVNAFKKAGVDNLDTYDAIVREVRTGREHRYKAVNIIGLVSGADMAKSEYENSGLGEGDAGDVWFEKLVLDEKKLAGHLMCRLAENVGIVLVHRRVVDVVNAAKIPGAQYIGFAHPAERSG
jgi:hypothetical protein